MAQRGAIDKAQRRAIIGAMQLIDYINTQRGKAAELARAIGVHPVLIAQWCGDRQVPANRCPDIERATAGQVTCEELRSDLAWVRFPDRSWSWNVGGKPLLDVCADVRARAA